ncbi:MAG: hypothetical protein Q4A17_01780 [Thermoguttaceae bacterium]|nr:hypothetical protein [Thermoguttaceae bacterium]
MKKTLPLLCLVLFFGVLMNCGRLAAEDAPYEPLAFTVSTNEAGPVKVQLAPMELITELNVVQTLNATLSSAADAPLSAALEFYSCDTIAPVLDGKNVKKVTRTVEIPAGGSLETAFQFQALEGTYSAHYPLHVKCRFTTPDGKTHEAHAVRVIETKVPQVKEADSKTVVKIGGVSLIGKSFFPWRTLDDQTFLLPNFTGSDPDSRAAYNTSSYKGRRCISSHPPYMPRGGSLFAAYEVQLPNEPGLSMNYGACVREVFPPEPPTDGVTFRFWASEKKYDSRGEIIPQEKTLLEEFHTASTNWVDRSFPLEKFAGKAIKLIVEVNPGPKNNTTCDGCFLSGLTINTGRGKSLAASDAPAGKPFTLALSKKYSAVITPGPNGLLDGKISIGDPAKPESFVTFNGISFTVGSQMVNSTGAKFTELPKLTTDPKDPNRLRFTATLLTNDQEFPILIEVYPENGMLVLDVPKSNPAELRYFQLGGSDQSLKRIYWGHGFVAENPGAFRKGMGGHDLAASHIGMDYPNGTSICLGASCAPVAMVVDGEKNLCTLEMANSFKLALVPASGGAFNAAIKYRKNNSWLPKTAPGVERKRGRLTFDVWGGRYAKDAEDVSKAVQYGVNDALFLKHVWQVWGYDVRLPDIWNENPDQPRVLPGLGTYEELKELAETCANAGIPFGVHDNYIDFYPDAEGFSYDLIDFNADGKPRKAWINHGAKAQSYQWRPDLFKPFLVRNLELDRKYLPTMDAYFVDVFTSANVYDYWDREGNFHSMTQTAECWKDCFRTISAALSHTKNGKVEEGITASEAGSDGLLGGISGADCQWMLIDNRKGGTWRQYVPCDDWARTPWFASVNHTNFSRHGAGYSSRYQAYRDPALHNSMSDDYISSEMLGGLDLMVEAGAVFAGSVRKHYLAQHVKRAQADQEISSVEFVEDCLAHQCVTWTNGMKVYVNQAETDWAVAGAVLPQYGFVVLDAEGKIISAIVRNPKDQEEIVEYSVRADGSFYLNGRGKSITDLLQIIPTMKSARVSEDGKKFEVVTNWHTIAPAPKELAIFAHVFEPHRGYGFTPTGWYDGYHCPIPTTQWGTSDETRDLETGADHWFHVPDGQRNGKYQVMVGLYDSKGSGRRFPLMGENAQEGRYAVAEFEVKDGKVVSEIKPVPITESPERYRSIMGNKTPFAFQGVMTLGSVYVKPTAKGLEILPLPPMEEFDVTLDRPVKRVTCDGQDVPVKDGTFRVKVGDAKIYQVEF